MSLNIEKTNYMIFTNHRKSIVFDNSVQISGSAIERVYNTKFLGIIIDSHLTWKSHIDSVCGKIAKNIGIILKCRKVFTTQTLTTLYNSFIMPYIKYGIHIWGQLMIAI